MRCKAEINGQTLGWFDTLAEAETAIAIAQDPYGPEAMAQLILSDEEFTQYARKRETTYVLQD